MTETDDAKLAMLRQTLQENVGMSKYEAEVYLALVRGGTSTMTELAEVSDVPKQRVYDTVGSLRENGFVEVVDDYPRKAYAVDPAEALDRVQERVEQAEEYLGSLHETVETVESGVALFKSESTIRKYVDDLISTAKHDILLLVPHDRLVEVDELLEACGDVHLRLILSDLPTGQATEDAVDFDRSLPDTVDDVRGVTSTEDFVLVVDRDRAMYWTRRGYRQADEDDQAYYVSNSRLAFVLDRFVSESVWPHARPVAGRQRQLSLPAEYLRIRDCLADVSDMAERRSIDSLTVEFEGYDTATGEEVSRTGTLMSYYFTEYDVRASLTLDLQTGADSVESSLVSVAGLGSRDADYTAERIVVRERGSGDGEHLTDETMDHLATCRSELPEELGSRSVVVAFDAFVDRMRKLIDRTDDEYHRVEQFETFRESLVRFEANDISPRALWRETETVPGGHVSHVGTFFDVLDYDLTLLGRFGKPIHSVFASRFDDQTLVSIGEATSTDYVRFGNRNFLLTEPHFDTLDWEAITEQVDLAELERHIDGANVLALGTWWATPELPDVVEGLADELWPRLESPPEHVHVSPGDVDSFSIEAIERGVAVLAKIDDRVPVTVTANRHQTRQFRDALLDGTAPEPDVERLRDRMGVSRFVMHSIDGSTLANADGVITANAPQVTSPRRIRNVDDHYISGLALGLAEDLSDGASLILGNAVASYFVRNDETPDSQALRSFIEKYDDLFLEE
jgi:sugar-specific transcriptional regulator TrmB